MCKNTPIVVLAFNVSGNEGDFMRLHEYAIHSKNAPCEDIKFELYTNLSKFTFTWLFVLKNVYSSQVIFLRCCVINQSIGLSEI